MNIHSLLFKSCDASSLSIYRIVWSFLMIIDLINERGLSQAHLIWSDDNIVPRCRFPLFNNITRFQNPEAMFMIYTIMFIALLAMLIGFYYRFFCFLYASGFWYLLIIEKSRWNNHSYLFGILALYGLFIDANSKFSIDSWRLNLNGFVPRWQYFILRFQIFLVYFYAGLKKFDFDWLGGFSMVQLSKHYVWLPFRFIFSDEFIDLFIIHLCGFLFDLTVGFFFLFSSTRLFAFIFCSFFNIMNSQMFHIGMFPWMMIGSMTIFCSYDWPNKFLFSSIKGATTKVKTTKVKPILCSEKNLKPVWTIRQILTVFMIMVFITFQAIFPFCYRFLPGLNTWTNGLYGYSWDMMLHNWNRVHTRIRVKTIQNDSALASWNYIDPEALTFNQRWTHQSDMLLQFRDCLKNILHKKHNQTLSDLRVDVWSSLNGRFVQRIFTPINLMNVHWSIWKNNHWVLPLSKRSTKWRDIAEKWSLNNEQNDNKNSSSFTIHIVDYPSYSLETFVEPNNNVTFYLLDGNVHIINGDNRQYLLTKQNDSLNNLFGTVKITVFGKTEAYYVIVQYWTLPAKMSKKEKVRMKASPFEALKHSVNNLVVGAEYLIKIMENYLKNANQKCSCEMTQLNYI